MRNQTRYPWTLNGLLFGAAVGTGFSAFESAGYAFEAMLSSNSVNTGIENIILRGVLSPFSHIIWTAITTAAIWRLKGAGNFKYSQLFSKPFLRIYIVPVILHMLWNSGFNLPLISYIFFIPTLHILLGILGWIIVFSLVQEGLQQVQLAQNTTF